MSWFSRPSDPTPEPRPEPQQAPSHSDPSISAQLADALRNSGDFVIGPNGDVSLKGGSYDNQSARDFGKDAWPY